MTQRFSSFAAALVLLTASLAAQAQTAPKGDPKTGKLLVYTCAGCHGIEGYRNAYPNYHVPKIGGQNYDYLVSALSDYRSGARLHPTMRAQAQSFSEQDIHDIAAYLSGMQEAAK